MKYYQSDTSGEGLSFDKDGQGANVETITDDITLSREDSGKTFLIATDAKTITLPPTISGMKVTVINTGADGNNIVTIAPNASDAIHGVITLASSVVELSGVDGKALINTKATATTGNSVTLLGDGVAGWYVLGATGIWASEA